MLVAQLKPYSGKREVVIRTRRRPRTIVINRDHSLNLFIPIQGILLISTIVIVVTVAAVVGPNVVAARVGGRALLWGLLLSVACPFKAWNASISIHAAYSLSRPPRAISPPICSNPSEFVVESSLYAICSCSSMPVKRRRN